MGRLVACANGNFTSSSTWKTCDANSINDASEAAAALTASDQSSSSFVPAAVAVDAILVKVASRATGSPSNTITVTLRNSTTATDVVTVTVNVSELAACDSTEREGGWYVFKFASTHTPNGTDSYLVKAKLSATTTAVSLWESSGTNWLRMLRTTTTAAPAAGDSLIVAKEMAAGSSTALTVTMDNNTTTQFGVGSPSTSVLTNAGMCICNGGTVTWSTGANTNLRFSGSVVVYSGGTLNMGTSGSPITRSFTAALEFVIGSQGDSGLWVSNGGTANIHGESRTSGKSFSWTLLNADAAASQATLNVADDTGWLSGDKIAIAPTVPTVAQAEQKILNANAGASSMVVTVNLSNIHLGTNGNVAEVILLTRNVKVTTTVIGSTTMTWVRVGATATFASKWTEYNTGTGSANRDGIRAFTITGGSFSMQHCSVWPYDAVGAIGVVNDAASADNFTLDNVVFYRTAGVGANISMAAASNTTSNWGVTNCVIVRGSTGDGMTFSNARGAINGNRIAGCAGSYALRINDGSTFGGVSGVAFGAIYGNHVHSNTCTVYQFQLNANLEGVTLGAPGVPILTVWRNTGGDAFRIDALTGSVPGWKSVTCYGPRAWGNASQNMTTGQGYFYDVIFREVVLAGDTSFATLYGYTNGVSVTNHEIRWENCTFGVASGTKTTHQTADMRSDQNNMDRHIFSDCVLNSSTRILTGSATPIGSYWAEMKKDGVAGAHQTLFGKRGTRSRNTVTVHSPEVVSEKLAPSNAGSRLYSSTRRAAVVSGTTVTVSVWVLKDASYGETTTPCLIVRANAAVGIDVDVTLDTLGAAVINTWTLLTGTTAAATADGVLEFVVAAHGTAGAVYVGQFTVS